MEKFIKENWFKLVIALVAIIISVSAFYYFVVLSHQKEARIAEQARMDLIEKNKKEAQIQEQAQIDMIEKNKLEAQKATKEALVKQQKENWDSFVNKCITDAYVELKTLQDNYDWLGRTECSHNPDFCSNALVIQDKAKDDAFITYKEEWVPQCKLGKRVFIHYEPYSL